MTCGLDFSSSACTTDDVVVGLAQLSSQVHGLAAFIFIVAIFVAVASCVALVLLYQRLP